MEIWTALVVHFQIQPSEAWRLTTHEYNGLLDCKMEKDGRRKPKLDNEDIDELKAGLMAARIEEEKAKHERHR